MSDELGRTRRYNAPEVLPPASQVVTHAPEVGNLPQGFLGMSIFARARYAGEQKQFEAYTRLVSAKNALIRVLAEQRRLVEDFEYASERVRNLDDIRETARQDVRNKLQSVKVQSEALKAETELTALRAETEKERLLYERDRLRQMREGLNASPKERAAPRSMADKFKEVGDEIEELERAVQAYRADQIRKAGGEENLSEDAKRLISQFEFVRNSAVNDVMAKLA
jgi:hypothetical protein